jgi:hypothetical protein
MMSIKNMLSWSLTSATVRSSEHAPVHCQSFKNYHIFA